jgi:hypothetical protein
MPPWRVVEIRSPPSRCQLRDSEQTLTLSYQPFHGVTGRVAVSHHPSPLVFTVLPVKASNRIVETGLHFRQQLGTLRHKGLLTRDGHSLAAILEERLLLVNATGSDVKPVKSKKHLEAEAVIESKSDELSKEEIAWKHGAWPRVVSFAEAAEVSYSKPDLVERRGFEPLTSSVRGRRSPS